MRGSRAGFRTRRLRRLALVAIGMLGLVAAGAPARSQPNVEIEWATSGAGPVSNPSVVAQIGDTLTATVYLENVGGTILAYSTGVSFDAAELSLLSATEFLPAGFSHNLTTGTGNRGLCSGLMFEAVSLPPATAVAGRFAMGETVFEVVAVVDDGMPDVTTMPCSGTTDQAIYDGSQSDVTAGTSFQSGGSSGSPAAVPTLGAAQVASVALLLLAAAALSAALARRRAG